jgi:RNA polymerase sigma-70 factor, ECF subfamily
MSVARPVELGMKAQASESIAPPISPSPTALLTRAMLKADEQAYRDFYDLYSHRLFAYLFVLCCGNEDQARDLLQQTLIKVARHIRVFDDEDIFWKWLATLARSSWVDDTRKRSRYSSALQRLWTWASHQSPLDEIAEQIPEPDLTQLIDQLPEPDRLLLKQKYIDGLSVREIAEENAATEKAIESRLTRARVRLKELISRKRSS